jgi:hypothetical protein
VADNASTDGTPALAAALAREEPRLRVLDPADRGPPRGAGGRFAGAPGDGFGASGSNLAEPLAHLVESGDARYFLLAEGGFGFRGQNDAVALMESACTDVTGSSSGASGTLYDCAGAADRIRTG